MGLSSFPTSAEGVLPVIVMNSLLSMTFLKNMVRSVLQVMGANTSPPTPRIEEQTPDGFFSTEASRERRVSITQFRSLFQNSTKNNRTVLECCVCLCGFEAHEEVSELSCKHFFHKSCLEKWFGNNHATCPLCRSID